MKGGTWKVERQKQRLSTWEVFKMVDRVVVLVRTGPLKLADTGHQK